MLSPRQTPIRVPVEDASVYLACGWVLLLDDPAPDAATVRLRPPAQTSGRVRLEAAE